MSDFQGIDFFKDLPTASEKTVAPKGVHEACVMEVEEVTTNSGDKAYKFTFELAGGDYFNESHYFNLFHPKEVVADIARKSLNQLAMAVGMDSWPEKKEAFVGKLCRAVIGKNEVKQPDGSMKTFTDIKGFLASEKSNVGSPASGGGSAVGSKPSLGS